MSEAPNTPALPIDETRGALFDLAVTALVVVGLCVLPYLIPGLARFKPWQTDDPLPLASLFENQEVVPSFAGTGEVTGGESTELGTAVAANLGAEEEEVPPAGPTIEIGPREYAGIEVFIDDPEFRGMRTFYEALSRTALSEEDAMTRVSHYGDSSIATDLITSTIRRRLQRRFGDGGHGFMLMGRGYLAYRHRDIEHRASDEWSLREIVRRHERSGLYGYGGVQFRGRPGAWSRFGTVEDQPVGTVVNRFEIWFQRHRRGGQIHYRVDGAARQVIETRQEETEDDVERIDVAPGSHSLEVRFGGHGQPRLYGVVLENIGAGVVYDSLGLVGARASRLLNYDADHIEAQLRRRGTDLLVLGFGGNEASDHILRERYQADYEAVIERMRSGRTDLACLVMAPLDQGTRDTRGRVVTMETLSDIVAGQRAAAREKGCAFFDTWAAMGGEGAMGEWLRSRPRLATSDLRHATPAGYEVIGNLFYKALLAGFAAYLEAEALRPSEAAAPTTPTTPTTPTAVPLSPTENVAPSAPAPQSPQPAGANEGAF